VLVEKFEMRKETLIISLTKAKTTMEIFKMYELFIHGDILLINYIKMC
jgi:hypothetical protein